jgi:TetR/AcrR family acrAB operon transcriptional repressor
MARKTKEDAQATRSAILDAAVRVFSIRGVSRASLADIAKEAGVTRGAIYWHFANKVDLLNALWEQVRLPFEPFAQASENPDEPDPLGKMKELLIFVFSSLAEDPRRQQLFRILLNKCEAVEDSGTIHLRQLDNHTDNFARVETVLRNAVDKGQLPTNLDLRLGSIFIISCIDGMLANWLMLPGLFDINKEVPILVEGCLQTLRSGLIRQDG